MNTAINLTPLIEPLTEEFRVLVQREFESERNRFYGDRFSKSPLKQELMAKMFHPRNIHKFEDWGFGFDD